MIGPNSVEPHPGQHGRDCPNKVNGERIRLLVWHFWRDPAKHRRLIQKIPELVNLQTDEEFARSLYQKEVNKPLSLYHNIVGVVAERVVA